MTQKVSIIIPIYNVDQSLDKCIESILNQSYRDYEIILVDDGSTDRSAEICDCYSEKYSFIYVVHQENSGVASARNTGLDKAIGEYICFIDPDDWIEKDLLAHNISLLENNQTDLVVFEYYKDTISNNKIIRQQSFEIPITNLSYSMDLIDAFILLHDKTLLFMIWNKIFRRNIIEENNLRFNNMPRLEDAEFLYRYALYISKVSINHKKYYHYNLVLNNSASLTQKPIENMANIVYFPLYKTAEELCDELKKQDIDISKVEKLNELYSKHLFRSVFFDLIVNMPKTKLTYLQKRMYIRVTFDKYKQVVWIKKMRQDYSKFEKLIWLFIKFNLVMPIIFLGNLYCIYKNIKPKHYKI